MSLLKIIPEDSWFYRWLEAHAHVEPPQSFQLLTAMSMFGAVCGRRVWYNHDGVRRLYPMLNCLVIGPSGIGKSYAMDIGLDLIRGLPKTAQPQLIFGSTPERLHADLRANPHAILVASELANFFNRQKYMEGMIPYVTELLDYRPVERRTKFEGISRIEEPSVTVIGGSTVEWLQDQLPDSAGAGGFLARFFIIKEDRKGRRDALPNVGAASEQRRLHQLRETTLSEFGTYVSYFQGEMGFSDFDAAEGYALWYANHHPESGVLSPFSARAGEFVLRCAMIMAMSRGHAGMQGTDISVAIKIYCLMIQKLQDVVVAFSPQGKLMEKVFQTVGDRGATLGQIRRAMRNSCVSSETDKFIRSLTDTGEIYKMGEFYIRTPRLG